MDVTKKEELLCEKEERLCETYDEIGRFLYLNGVCPQDIDDFLQEIFIKALRSLHQLKDVEKMVPWLRAISINVIRSKYNKEHRTAHPILTMEEDGVEIELDKLAFSNHRHGTNEIEKLTEKEAMEEIFCHFDEPTKTIFRLRYYLGYSLKDIANMRRMNYSTVKSIHQRALAKMKTIVRKKEDGEYE